MVQPGVVSDNVPAKVGLRAQTEGDEGENIDEFVDVVHGGGLSTHQLQQQPQMQGDTVDLHKESHYSAG